MERKDTGIIQFVFNC